MKFVIKLVLFACMALPSAVFGMEEDPLVKELGKIRKAVHGHEEDEDWLVSSFTLPTAPAAPSPRGQAQATFDPASFATSRIALNASRSTPKFAHIPSNLHDINDDEWGDGIIAAPTLPPFEPQPTSSNPSDEDDIDVYAPANNNAPQDEDDAPPVVPPRDDAPIIEEMPEPIDEPAPAVPAQEELNFEDQGELQARGVREEINRCLQRRPNARSNRPHSSKRPLPPAPKAPAKHETIKPKAYSAPNLFISAGLLSLFSWLDSSSFQNKLAHVHYPALAQEFRTFGKQTAAANIAQQLLPGKQANSLAFTTAFALLHACEVGLKHVAAKVLAKTNRGKKIAAAYKKIPAHKRKIVDGVGTAGSWLLKTLMARAIAR